MQKKIRICKNPECKSEFYSDARCGDTDLRHLCISHIHNDGGKRRKNGEPHGASLFSYFNSLGWPESLKEDYCLECFNCNCSRKAHAEGEEKED